MQTHLQPRSKSPKARRFSANRVDFLHLLKAFRREISKFSKKFENPPRLSSSVPRVAVFLSKCRSAPAFSRMADMWLLYWRFCTQPWKSTERQSGIFLGHSGAFSFSSSSSTFEVQCFWDVFSNSSITLYLGSLHPWSTDSVDGLLHWSISNCPKKLPRCNCRLILCTLSDHFLIGRALMHTKRRWHREPLLLKARSVDPLLKHVPLLLLTQCWSYITPYRNCEASPHVVIHYLVSCPDFLDATSLSDAMVVSSGNSSDALTLVG